MKIRNYLIWVFLIFLIIFRYYSTRSVYKNGDTVRVTGMVLGDPVIYASSQYLKLSGLKIYLQKYPVIHYGDLVQVEGQVADGQLKSPKLISLSTEKSFASKTRNRIIGFYQKILPEPSAGLLAGIVLGSKGALDRDFYETTKLTGTAHIVVASGTNITFVAAFLMATATVFLKRRKAIYIVTLGCILYLFLSGFDAPLIRAAVMSSFIFLGQEVGRIANKWRVYFFTICLMLAYKPDWLFDFGFLLSFAATASIMLFEPKINHILRRFPLFIKETLSVTLAAEIGVLPILLFIFGQFNVLSPLINLLVLWTVPPLMVLGALGGALGLIWPFLGKMVLWLSYPLLLWFVRVVAIFNF